DFGIGNAAGSYHPDLTELNLISRLAGLPHETPNFYSMRECASSMETMQRIAMAIMLGTYDCGIAFGVERMTRSLTTAMDRVEGDRTSGFNKRVMMSSKEQRDMPSDHFDYFSVPIPDHILDSPSNPHMVQTAQNVVEMYGLTREELDAYSVRSQHKLAAAYDAGIYKDEVMALEIEEPVFDEKGNWVEKEKGPTIIFDQDESVRGNTTVEGLAKLKPIRGIVSYDNQEVRVTAGNSCPTNSGASALLVMSEEKAIQLGLEPLARIIGWGNGGVKQQIMGLGPIVSTKNALRHAGLEPDQIDRVEFNEAFAAQVIPSIKELNIPEEIVNVNGGSIGIGHPIGATGARMTMTLCKELRRSKKRYGLITQCIGAGQGATTIFENMDC
ncbi:MAG: thiolase family protein, partial [Desulfobacterales bacterium]|nr:thiolase family protein [Desulfobacterales bacterium]